MSNSSEAWFVKRSDQVSLKKGLGGNLGNREKAVKKSHKTENGCKGELKHLKKNIKMLYIMVKCTKYCRYLKKIKNTPSNVTKKYESSSSDSSSKDSDSSYIMIVIVIEI